jgi:hypothetical protein
MTDKQYVQIGDILQIVPSQDEKTLTFMIFYEIAKKKNVFNTASNTSGILRFVVLDLLTMSIDHQVKLEVEFVGQIAPRFALLPPIGIQDKNDTLRSRGFLVLLMKNTLYFYSLTCGVQVFEPISLLKKSEDVLNFTSLTVTCSRINEQKVINIIVAGEQQPRIVHLKMSLVLPSTTSNTKSVNSATASTTGIATNVDVATGIVTSTGAATSVPMPITR